MLCEIDKSTCKLVRYLTIYCLLKINTAFAFYSDIIGI